MEQIRKALAWVRDFEAAVVLNLTAAVLGMLVYLGVIPISDADGIQAAIAAGLSTVAAIATRLLVWSQSSVDQLKREVAERAATSAADVPLAAAVPPPAQQSLRL